MPAPHAWVDVEQLQATVARVALEFDLDDPFVAQHGEEPRGDLFDVRRLDRLHVRAGPTEVHRPLPSPARDHRRHRLAFAAERGVRELARPAAHDQLLDHDERRVDQRRGLRVARRELGGILDSPGLRHREAIELRPDRRLEDRRIPNVQASKVFRGLRVMRTRVVDVEPGGEPVR